jgi:branched-chain amino acid aminotransferase
MIAQHTQAAALASRLGEVDFSNLPFGSIFGDHMLVAAHRDGHWSDAALRPYGPLSLPPSINALQYGLAVFEGLKAFRTVDDRVVLFRPEENARRLRASCRRLALPELPEALVLDGLKQLVARDRGWVPDADAGSLYIRPIVFATDEDIRVRPAASCLFVVFTCPVGPYYAEPLRLLATTRYVRAFPGGTGDVKPGGNYAVAFRAEREAQEQGYHSVLWLDGIERRYVEECGVMNAFFVLDGVPVTPNLTGTILPGVTRDSAITLLREMGVPVEQRPIAIDELIAAHERGALWECFGTGTAATVAHVAAIGYDGVELVLPAVEQREIGPALLERFARLRSGRDEDRHRWLVPV